MNGNLASYSAILFLSAFAAGTLTLLRRWSDDWLHLFISFGAGIFLGAVFFELLPEAMAGEERSVIGVAVLVGYLLIFFVERFLMSRGAGGEVHSHRVISIAAFIGLSVHSIIDGLGLSIMVADPELGEKVFLSILAHQVPAAFSVGSLLALGRMGRSAVLLLLGLFAALPPAGALLFSPVISHSSQAVYSIIIGAMTGTFLYVATGDLLPEVFHSKRNQWRNLALLLAGLGIMAGISFGFDHAHGH